MIAVITIMVTRIEQTVRNRKNISLTFLITPRNVQNGTFIFSGLSSLHTVVSPYSKHF